MNKTTMIDRKKEVIREIAYMFLFGDISNAHQLSYIMRKLYTKHIILFRWRYRKFKAEFPFIYLASKYVFGIELDKFNPFAKIRQIDYLYREKKLNKINATKKRRRELDILVEILKLNLNYVDLNLLPEGEGIDYYKLMLNEFPTCLPIFSDLLRGYVGNKILEGILDRTIANRIEKEKFKMRLCNLYLISAPSDEEIHQRHVPNNRHIDFAPFELENILNIVF